MFPARQFYTEQMFVLVRMELNNRVDVQPMKRFKRYKGYAIKFEMLLSARVWDFISVCEWFGGTAHLRTLERTLLLYLMPKLCT